MKIYSPEATTPAAAITLATAASNTQPILFTNHFGDKGDYINPENPNEKKEVKLEWTLKEIIVNLTRDWGTSQAQITLTCELPDTAIFLPSLPDVSLYRGGDYPYLDREDEIRIYAGYVPSSTTPITADLLDEVPFNFIDINTGKPVTHNPNKPLCPIFWGFIDNITYDANPQGFKVTLQCRDRTRVFADTRVLSLKAFQGKVNKDNTNAEVAQNEATLSGLASGDRTEILLQLANAASGNPFGENIKEARCWRLIERGMSVKGFTIQNEQTNLQFPSQDPSAWIQTATCRIMNDQAKPRFNTWVEKPPIVKGEAKASLQVLNKTPLEIVDYIAKTEERPMDFFASHINGDFILGPRVKDESGFDDVDRQYRTYFHRTYPKDVPDVKPPTFNAMIQSMRVVSSSLFSFNNFVIVDSSTTRGTATSLIGSLRFGYSVLDPKLANRSVTPPCKTQIIYDGGLATYPSQEYGALLIALANARVWSRDTQGIEMSVVGDPTFCPGEAIRVYNTFLHDFKTYTVVDSKADAANFVEVKRKENDSKEVSTKVKEIPVDQRGEVNLDVSNFVNDTINSVNRLPSDINNLILPYYTVRVVQHKLTAQGDKGYTTSLLSVSDI
jgi:hypothetical protein